MQLSLPWRFGWPPTSIPVLNRGHPLARGLIGCWLPGVLGGFDLCSNTQLIKSANASFYPTTDGMGSGAITLGSYCGWNSANLAAPSPLLSWSQLTIFYRGTIIGNSDSYACLAGIAWDNANTSPYFSAAMAAQGGVTDWSQLAAAWANGTSFTSGPVISLIPTLGREISLASTFVSNGGNVNLYLNGALQNTTAFGTNPPNFGTTPQFVIHLTPSQVARTPNASNNAAFVWNRALSQTELVYLHNDPYCFLWYPEDDIFAEMVGLAALPISQIPVFQIANSMGWRKTDLEGY